MGDFHPQELEKLDRRVSRCDRCPRLVQWRTQVAAERRRAFRDQDYWGRPVPGFGPADASILLYGLAPAAHGANRTGRMFTGDRSGDFLYAALHRAGLANQPTSTGRDDGLMLSSVRISAAVRCAPPANKPTPQERDNCQPWSEQELALLEGVRVIVCLGAFAWNSALRLAQASPRGAAPARPRPRFGHGGEAHLGELHLIGCFHPSQQNTFTGRLTPAMLDSVVNRAKLIAGLAPGTSNLAP